MKTLIIIGTKPGLYTIRLVALTVVMLMVLSIPQIAVTAYGQGMFGGMHYLAERENREKEQEMIAKQKAIENEKRNICQITVDADKDEGKNFTFFVGIVKEKAIEKKC